MEVYSIVIDESTHMKDTCKLALFVRGVTPTFDIVENVVKWIHMDTSTEGDNLERIIKGSPK